jgi:hypothetical protein
MSGQPGIPQTLTAKLQKGTSCTQTRLLLLACQIYPRFIPNMRQLNYKKRGQHKHATTFHGFNLNYKTRTESTFALTRRQFYHHAKSKLNTASKQQNRQHRGHLYCSSQQTLSRVSCTETTPIHHKYTAGASICVKHWGAQSLPSPPVSPSPPSSFPFLPSPPSLCPPSPPFPPLPLLWGSGGYAPGKFLSGTHARTRVLVHF